MNPTDPSTHDTTTPTPTGPTSTTSTDDNPYDLLAQDHDEGHRWAFGTGFADPLSGVDASVPEQLDPHALARWCLALGDDALIYSHRLQQWVARLPELEEETAVANIALDLLGQARLLLSRPADRRPDRGPARLLPRGEGVQERPPGRARRP